MLNIFFAQVGASYSTGKKKKCRLILARSCVNTNGLERKGARVRGVPPSSSRRIGSSVVPRFFSSRSRFVRRSEVFRGRSFYLGPTDEPSTILHLPLHPYPSPFHPRLPKDDSIRLSTPIYPYLLMSTGLYLYTSLSAPMIHPHGPLPTPIHNFKIYGGGGGGLSF